MCTSNWNIASHSITSFNTNKSGKTYFVKCSEIPKAFFTQRHEQLRQQGNKRSNKRSSGMKGNKVIGHRWNDVIEGYRNKNEIQSHTVAMWLKITVATIRYKVTMRWNMRQTDMDKPWCVLRLSSNVEHGNNDCLTSPTVSKTQKRGNRIVETKGWITWNHLS